ncbi:MAG: hypothetical protein RLZZ480_777 [Candidatus Parcubacteria bacterium]
MQKRTALIGMFLALFVALGFMSVSSPASARETYHGFVKDAHYLGRGGIPATFEEVADAPDSVFRSRLAYDTLRAHVGTAIGRSLSESDFRALLRSGDVRLVPCTGSIDTAGVTDSGRIGFRKRACYRGEMLIQVRLQDGRWLTVASQGCYNPIRGEVPRGTPVAEEPPAPPAVVSSRMKRVGEVVTPGPQLSVGGYVMNVCPADCVCDASGRIISSPYVTTGGFPTTSGMFENN